ncbi:hypothetical protein SPI_03405 [Niveomyces insectorum RCEF 264]|uniref:Uncharacterized protein n=1 Tax=Niveomyces insectorum RCEF 264 TaxID=1081102 RepID=A0A162J3F7_9HYPO|nr:hypothetical protein SPI_03405 [Niveomyces insectorum RCEF 264]
MSGTKLVRLLMGTENVVEVAGTTLFSAAGSKTEVRRFLECHHDTYLDELLKKSTDELTVDFQKMLDHDEAFFRTVDAELPAFRSRWRDVMDYRRFYGGTKSDPPSRDNLLAVLFYFEILPKRVRLFLPEDPAQEAAPSAKAATGLPTRTAHAAADGDMPTNPPVDQIESQFSHALSPRA